MLAKALKDLKPFSFNFTGKTVASVALAACLPGLASAQKQAPQKLVPETSTKSSASPVISPKISPKISTVSKAKYTRLLDNLEEQSQRYIAAMESEKYQERQAASKAMLELLLKTEGIVFPVPEDTLSRIGINITFADRCKRYTPEQVYRLTEIEKSFQKEKPHTRTVILDPVSCKQAINLIWQEYGIKIKADFNFTDQPICLPSQPQIFLAEQTATLTNLTEIISSICKITNTIPSYDDCSKKRITLNKIKVGKAHYCTTSAGLFILLEKEKGNVELHAFADPATELVTFEDLRRSDNSLLSLFTGRAGANFMDGNVHQQGNVSYQILNWPMNEGEIELKVWVAYGAQTVAANFQNNEELNVNNIAINFEIIDTDGSKPAKAATGKSVADQPLRIRQQIKVFPQFAWPATQYTFDALSTLQAGVSGYSFYDNKGREIGWKSDAPALKERTITRELVLGKKPSKVEFRSYSGIKQYCLKFSCQNDSVSVVCNAGIEGILDSAGSSENKNLPQRLNLVKGD